MCIEALYSNVIQYDSEEFKYITSYMTFEIPQKSELWELFKVQKDIRLANYKKMQRIELKVLTPKPKAPMIVHSK